jgi:O-antigen/teichoic acid export membrane protein
LIRGVASVLVLWKFSATIEAFFWTQLVTSLTHIFIIRHLLWKKLESNEHHPRFRLDLLKNVWSFAAGISGIGLISSLLMQLDKILLSKFLSLEVFGYYAIANVVSMNVYRLFGPIYSAIYPKLTNLVAIDNKKDLVDFYHKSAQFLAAAVFPAVMVLIFFSYELLLIWLQNPVTAAAASPVASILVVGTLINGIMHIPYGLQLALGWTSLGLRFGIISVFIFGGLLVVLSNSYGVIGAAIAWPIQQALYLIITVPIMHRRVLQGELWSWYTKDVFLPLALSALPASIAWYIKPFGMGQFLTLIYILVTYIFSLIAVLTVLPVVRSVIVFKKHTG